MDPALESYQNADYAKTIELADGKDVILASLARLKLNQKASIITIGEYHSKPQTEHLIEAYKDLQDAKASTKGEQGVLAEAIAEYYLDLDIEPKISNCQLGEAKYYLGLILYEKCLYENAAKAFLEAKDIPKDCQTNRQCMLATCYFRLGQFDKCTKAIEEVTESSLAYSILASVYMMKGDAVSAEQWITQALNLHPNCFYGQLIKAKATKKLGDAIANIEKLLKEDPENLRLKRCLVSVLVAASSGQVKAENGEIADFPRGEGIVRSAQLMAEVRVKQKWISLTFFEGMVQFFLRNHAEATKLFDDCIKNNWEAQTCKYYCGIIKLQQFDYKAASTTFKELIEEKIELQSCVFWNAWIYYKQNQYDLATKQLELGKESIENYVLLGKILHQKGDKQQGDQWLTQAQKLGPNSLYLKLVKAQVNNKTEEAITLLENTLKDDPFNVSLKLELLDNYMTRNQEKIWFSWGEFQCKPKGMETTKSMQLVQELRKIMNCPKLQYIEAVLNYYLDNYTEAWEQFEKSTWQQGHCKYYQAMIKKEQLKLTEAAELFTKAITYTNSPVTDGQQEFTLDDECKSQRAQIFLKQYQPEKVTKELEHNQQGCQYYVLLGQAFLLKGDSKQADSWFNESLKINSNCLYSKIAKASLTQKQEEVSKLLDSAMKQDPENYVIMWYKGKTLNRLNKFEQAIGYFDKAIQKQYIPAYASKAKSLRALKKQNDALQVLQEGLKIAPDFCPILTVMAQTQYDLNNHEEALKYADQCLNQDANNIIALEIKAFTIKKQGKHDEANKMYEQIIKIDPLSIKGYVGKAEIAKNNGKDSELFDSLQLLSDIVIAKNKFRASINPHVAKNAGDLIQLQTQFELKGQFIDKALKNNTDPIKQQKFQNDFLQLKQKKDEICQQKMDSIMQPLVNPQEIQFVDVLRQLDSITKELEKYSIANEKQQYENILHNPQFEEMTQEDKDLWEKLKSSGTYDQAKIQDWFQSNQGNEKYNYAVAFYWTLLSHIDSYRAIIATQNDIPDKDKFISYVKDGVLQGQKFIPNIPHLGNICTILDDIIDCVFSQVKNKKYADRIRSICKIIHENETTKIADNLSLVLTKAAQDIADQKTFDSEKKLKEQSNIVKYTMKYLNNQIEEVKAQFKAKEIILYETKGGSEALNDVVLVLTYFTEYYSVLIVKAKKVPLNTQMVEIINGNKEIELLQESKPIQDALITPLNLTYQADKDFKQSDVIKRDQNAGQGGCCVIQ